MAVLLERPEIAGGAVLSSCRRYRYQLTRSWDPALPTVAFVGLNPSTANATKDDATVRRCVGFARDWGFGGLMLVNLFALRSSEPFMLYSSRDPIGPDNDAWLERIAAKAETVVAAWGTHGALLKRDLTARKLIPKLYCLGRTREGHPRHPLYLPKDTPFEAF